MWIAHLKVNDQFQHESPRYVRRPWSVAGPAVVVQQGMEVSDSRGLKLERRGAVLFLTVQLLGDRQDVPAFGDHVPAAGVIEVVGVLENRLRHRHRRHRRLPLCCRIGGLGPAISRPGRAGCRAGDRVGADGNRPAAQRRPRGSVGPASPAGEVALAPDRPALGA